MKKSGKIKVLFTGGGTGGHIFPIIAVVREIRKLPDEEKKNRDFEFFYLGPRDDFVNILLSQESIKIKYVLAGKLRRYLNFKSFFQNLFDVLIKGPVGIVQAFLYIFVLAPDVIFSKGGFGSIPAVIAGWLLGVPIFLQESDSIPGLASRILGRFCAEIFISFRKTPYFRKNMILTGNPVRRELFEGSKQEAADFFKLSPDRPVIFVMGGSQGAQYINDEILEIIPELVRDFEVIHQAGEKNVSQVRAEAKVVVPEYMLKHHRVYGFMKEEELEKAYAAADIVVSRAGSGSIFEIAAAGKPSILIPLANSAQGHQLENAYTYAQKGAAIVIEEQNFTSHFFLEKVRYLLSTPSELEKMTKAAREFARPMAAKVIASYMAAYLT